MKVKPILHWILRIVPALIMLQTFFFKFTGAPGSIFIFKTVGMEPWGRYGSGVAEAIAAILILIPAFTAFGALIGTGVLSGAIFFHLTSLGIVVQDDGGSLFIMALVSFICCALLIVIEKDKLLKLIGK